MGTVFDWRSHHTGPPQPCVLCGQPAMCRNEDGLPCHKVCAEAVADRIATNRASKEVLT
jgi:hypothetical protein